MPPTINADLLNLATAIEPEDVSEIASVYKLPVNEENFLLEAHAKLRPVEFASDGLFVCGLAHYPKPLEESISQAMAAASRAAMVLSKSSIKISPLVSQVNTEICIGCGLCSRMCPSETIEIIKDEKGKRPKFYLDRCTRCHQCADICPVNAIELTKDYETVGFDRKEMIIE